MEIQGYIQRGFALTRILTCRDNRKTAVQTGNKTDQVKKRTENGSRCATTLKMWRTRKA